MLFNGVKMTEDKNKNLVEKITDYPKMTLKEFNKMPLNSKVTHKVGLKVRLNEPKFYVGDLATYYVCEMYGDHPANRMIVPHQVWLIEDIPEK